MFLVDPCHLWFGLVVYGSKSPFIRSRFDDGGGEHGLQDVRYPSPLIWLPKLGVRLPVSFSTARWSFVSFWAHFFVLFSDLGPLHPYPLLFCVLVPCFYGLTGVFFVFGVSYWGSFCFLGSL